MGWCASLTAQVGEGVCVFGKVRFVLMLSWGAYDKVELGWKFRRDRQGCHVKST